ALFNKLDAPEPNPFPTVPADLKMVILSFLHPNDIFRLLFALQTRFLNFDELKRIFNRTLAPNQKVKNPRDTLEKILEDQLFATPDSAARNPSQYSYVRAAIQSTQYEYAELSIRSSIRMQFARLRLLHLQCQHPADEKTVYSADVSVDYLFRFIN